MAQNHRNIDGPALGVVILMNLAAAYTDRAGAKQDFIVCRLARHRHFPQFHRSRLQRILDDRRHRVFRHITQSFRIFPSLACRNGISAEKMLVPIAFLPLFRRVSSESPASALGA